MKRGDHVVTDSGYAGTVVAVEGGRALVQHVCPCAGYPYKATWPVEVLSLDPRCC